jgi:integrase
MSESNSTPSTPAGKPVKPYPEFPLFPHAAGVWAKKIRGKLHYFGQWSDPDAALAKYGREKDALHAGRTPRPEMEGLTVKELANQFLNHKKDMLGEGRLSPRTWGEYRETTDLLVTAFGKGRLVEDLGPDDFAALRRGMAKRWGPVRLGNAIQRVRTVFKFALDNGLTDRPPVFGQGFSRPSAGVLRRHRAKQGAKLFTAEEVRRMIDAAGPQLRAMLLLGINAGFGVADSGRLPLTALDLESGWLTFPRPKTGIARRCPLWPKTVAALREALAQRPRPQSAQDAELVFLTAQGRPWHKEDASSPLCFKVKALLKALGINGRKGLGIYTLRHCFETVAGESVTRGCAPWRTACAGGCTRGPNKLPKEPSRGKA